MVIKSWGPLFALLVLFGAGLFGLLVVDHPEPHNRSQPTVSPHKNSRPGELVSTHDPNQYGKKERKKVTGLILLRHNFFRREPLPAGVAQHGHREC
jgi:hypothetical protein